MIRPAASRMSSTRRRHSLAGGTNGLGEDSVAQLPLHGISHDQVHACPEDLLQPSLNAKEMEESDGLIEVDQEIDVALLASLSARYRAEQVERAHPEGGELG